MTIDSWFGDIFCVVTVCCAGVGLVALFEFLFETIARGVIAIVKSLEIPTWFKILVLSFACLWLMQFLLVKFSFYDSESSPDMVIIIPLIAAVVAVWGVGFYKIMKSRKSKKRKKG
ncbi:MAG: hypothetical protein FWF82_01665 [Oscillospiraceae bacterium]|nr:hypothetical protein [Oscillospiraceae bacterium]